MQACDQQYHAPKEVIGRAETMMMQDLKGDAEHGLITIDYNDRLKIAIFKARVGRINERVGSVLVQQVRRDEKDEMMRKPSRYPCRNAMVNT